MSGKTECARCGGDGWDPVHHDINGFYWPCSKCSGRGVPGHPNEFLDARGNRSKPLDEQRTDTVE